MYLEEFISKSYLALRLSKSLRTICKIANDFEKKSSINDLIGLNKHFYEEHQPFVSRNLDLKHFFLIK